MADTYTARLRLVKQEVGANPSTWGGNLNDQMIQLIDDAVAGIAQVDVSGGDVTLTSVNGAADQARMSVLEFFGNVASRTVTVPPLNKLYLIRNTQAAFDVVLTSGVPASVTLTVNPQTSVWAHVGASGDVQAVSVPVSIDPAAPGGIETTGRFATPAFEDVGDLNARLLQLSDGNGVVFNGANTDKEIVFKSATDSNLLRIVTGSNPALEIGTQLAPITFGGDLILNHPSQVSEIRQSDQNGSILMIASDGTSDGSSLSIVGDTSSIAPGEVGNVELAGTAAPAIQPVLKFTGFRGGVVVDGNAVWHAGNDGAGSGLDADELRGSPGAEYFRLSNTGAQTAQGPVTFQQQIRLEQSDSAFSAISVLPRVDVEKVDGQGASVQRWRYGMAASTAENLTWERDIANIAMELDAAEEQLYRGAKSRNDPYLSLKGDYVDTNGGAKGHLRIGGILLQYGEVSVSPNTFALVTFSTPFPTAVRSINLTQEVYGGGGVATNSVYQKIDNSSFRIWNYTGGTLTVSWMAMGD